MIENESRFRFLVLTLLALAPASDSLGQIGNTGIGPTWRYNYTGPFYLDPLTNELNRLTGELSFTAPSNKNLTLNLQQVWDRGFRPQFSLRDGLGPIINGVRFEDFSITDGNDSFRINIPGDEPQRNGSFYRSDIRFELRTDSNGDITTWRLWSDVARDQSNGFDPYGYYLEGVVPSPAAPNVGPLVIENFNDWDAGRPSVNQTYRNLDPWTQETFGRDHIIVLSHGFSPGRDRASPNYLIEGLKQPIIDRLTRDGVDLDRVHFVTETWDQAYVRPVPLGLLEYDNAYNATDAAGSLLGVEVRRLYEELTDGDRKPTVHLIGHSLGSIVNAEAVEFLNGSGIPIDLVTILDSPRNSSNRVAPTSGVKEEFRQDLARFDASLLFYEKMPQDSVAYVENFYGGDEVPFKLDGINVDTCPGGPIPICLSPDVRIGTPAFGQPIAGAAPEVSSSSGRTLSGKFLPSSDHTEVWAQYYRGLIDSDSELWKTPALYAEQEDLPYPADNRWNPNFYRSRVVEEYNTAGNARTRLRRLMVNLVVGDSVYIDGVQRRVGTIDFEDGGVRATSNSPSSFGAAANLDEVIGLTFSYLVEGADEGILSLTFNDQELWTLDLSTLGAELSDTVYVSSLDLAGDGEFLWTYDSPIIGSSALFSDLELVVVSVLIPEPSCLVLIAGLATLNRHRTSRCH